LKNLKHNKGDNFATGKVSLAQLIELKPLLTREKVFLASLPFSLTGEHKEVREHKKVTSNS
jgi:hypothetical protein